MDKKLGFIGAGNMAEAIAGAAIRQGVIEPGLLVAADPSPDRRAVFTKLGIDTTDDNAAMVRQCEQVLLAVKPQMLDQVAATLAEGLQEGQVVISIMAGVTTARLDAALDAKSRGVRLVRVMPNTPMLVGCGMAAIALGEGATDADAELAMALFAAGGKAIRVDESLMDAVTAVSGSGPAYVFYLAEAMEQAAAALGLGEHSRLLVAQTLLGAAKLLGESSDTAAELRRKVTSPGGTTEAAIRHMDEQAVRQHLVEAVQAAAARSRELGGK